MALILCILILIATNICTLAWAYNNPHSLIATIDWTMNRIQKKAALEFESENKSAICNMLFDIFRRIPELPVKLHFPNSSQGYWDKVSYRNGFWKLSLLNTQAHRGAPTQEELEISRDIISDFMLSSGYWLAVDRITLGDAQGKQVLIDLCTPDACSPRVLPSEDADWETPSDKDFQ